MEERYYATGKRKESIAKVWLTRGAGNIVVNDRPIDTYFPRETSRMQVRQPLTLTESTQSFDIRADVQGGGLSGQAGALRLGIARALIVSNPNLRLALKRAGMLTRDSRIVERKKYGRAGARRRFQFSKR